MQVDTDDRYDEKPPSAGIPKTPLVLALLALAVIGYWYFSANDGNAPVTPLAGQAPAAVIAPAEPEPTPDIPEPEPAEPEPLPTTSETAVAPEPELTLEASDPVVKEQLAETFNSQILGVALETDNLIERGTALIDATSQGLLLHKLIPLPAPQGKFAVTIEDDRIYMDPDSFHRYDSYATAISDLDPQVLANNFHKFRPLLEQAYAALGYKSQDLDNALIRALDQISTAPILENPALLQKEVATYKYADEALEELSPLAKQLLRMGPENQALIQQQARAIREALLSPTTGQ